ncbi:MAG: hypothetical protein LC799_20985 [Actinobacteria bacterium]|nr:hypothetical protein [Actinomycetota bacterium]
MGTGLAVVMALGLILHGCGDDDDDGGAAASTTTSSTTTAPVTVRCGTVGFTPNSEDAASEITATGTSCEEARPFVEMAGRQTSSGGPDELDLSGYHCVRTRSEQDPLPRAFFECTKGSTTITFVRS